jgi:hypothetical protein
MPLKFVDKEVYLAPVLVPVLGAVWVYYRYLREGFHRPRIEFDIECKFIAVKNGECVAEIVVSANNKGMVRFTFPEIRLRARGLKEKSNLNYWVKDDKQQGVRLEFPEKIFTENIIPPKYKYYFVEPGVRQPITYITKIPKDIKVLSLHASFRYRFRREIHTSEKVFEVSN